MLAAAATHGDVKIKGISYNIIENIAIKMKEAGPKLKSVIIILESSTQE